MRVIQLETNKLYQFETRMQSSIEERQKTLQSLKNHGEVVQNQFFQSRQLESSKDEVNEGKESGSYWFYISKFISQCKYYLDEKPN